MLMFKFGSIFLLSILLYSSDQTEYESTEPLTPTPEPAITTNANTEQKLPSSDMHLSTFDLIKAAIFHHDLVDRLRKYVLVLHEKIKAVDK